MVSPGHTAVKRRNSSLPSRSPRSREQDRPQQVKWPGFQVVTKIVVRQGKGDSVWRRHKATAVRQGVPRAGLSDTRPAGTCGCSPGTGLEAFEEAQASPLATVGHERAALVGDKGREERRRSEGS